MVFRIRGAILLGILITAVAGIPFGLVKYCGFITPPPSISPTLFKLDILGAFDMGLVVVIFVFFFMDLFDSIGTFIGLANQGNFFDKNGKMPKMKEALATDAVGTMVGAVCGTSTITSYVESSAGIADGARTGLTGIVVGVLFLLTMFFGPLVKMIGGGVETGSGVLYPVIAPVLIVVGFLILKSIEKIKWDDFAEAFPAFLIMVVMALSVSITEGIAAGFISYALLKVVSRRWKEVDWLFYVFAILFLVRYLVR
jgi:AGZA family xanthine/uracil permease-like MFS transporter